MPIHDTEFSEIFLLWLYMISYVFLQEDNVLGTKLRFVT